MNVACGAVMDVFVHVIEVLCNLVAIPLVLIELFLESNHLGHGVFRHVGVGIFEADGTDEAQGDFLDCKRFRHRKNDFSCQIRVSRMVFRSFEHNHIMVDVFQTDVEKRRLLMGRFRFDHLSDARKLFRSRREGVDEEENGVFQKK